MGTDVKSCYLKVKNIHSRYLILQNENLHFLQLPVTTDHHKIRGERDGNTLTDRHENVIDVHSGLGWCLHEEQAVFICIDLGLLRTSGQTFTAALPFSFPFTEQRIHIDRVNDFHFTPELRLLSGWTCPPCYQPERSRCWDWLVSATPSPSSSPVQKCPEREQACHPYIRHIPPWSDWFSLIWYDWMRLKHSQHTAEMISFCLKSLYDITLNYTRTAHLQPLRHVRLTVLVMSYTTMAAWAPL